MQLVLSTRAEFGLKRGENGLQVYLMAELPSNVLLAEEFSEYIDGFSIGSNDLTQLTLGLDRDSALVSHLYDERNPAVKALISQLIKVAKKKNVKVGICGQGPSDFPEFAEFLVQEGIDSISVTPDSVLKTLLAIHNIESKRS
jgi:pyruvate,water dikinase